MALSYTSGLMGMINEVIMSNISDNERQIRIVEHKAHEAPYI
jgi:hypothetical protein